MPPRHGVVAAGRFSDPQSCRGAVRGCERQESSNAGTTNYGGLRVGFPRRSSGSSSKWLAGVLELGYGQKQEPEDDGLEIRVRHIEPSGFSYEPLMIFRRTESQSAQ